MTDLIITLVLLVFGFTNNYFVSTEVFTSVDQMRLAIDAQRKILDELNNYIAEGKTRLDEITKTVDNFRRESFLIEDNAALEDTISNPVGAYLMVKKYHKDNFNPFLNNLLEHHHRVNASLKRIEQFMEMLPSDEDFDGSLAGLVRLQETYNLPINSFIDGFNRTTSRRLKMAMNQTGTGGDDEKALDASDCFLAGRIAYVRGSYDSASLWLTEAYEMAAKQAIQTINKTELLEYLSVSNFQIGKISIALGQTEELLSLEPNHPYAAANINFFKDILAENVEKSQPAESSKQFPSSDPFEMVFKKLCRGERTLSSIKNANKLYCDYARNNDPRLLIAPLKRETLHLNPWIVIYHNVISDAEIAYFRQTTLPILNRAETIDGSTGEMEPADYRISKIAWLENNTANYYGVRLLNRISAMTQLTLESSEPFQVANYGIGGYYMAHFDFSEENSETAPGTFNIYDRGNRLVTLLFYISDVEAGGATVFTDLGLTVFPKKGAALFWYNLYKSGEGDRSLKHGACPVLFGIINKWFRFAGNAFWHPCTLNQFDRFKHEDIENAVPTYHRANGRFQFHFDY